MIGKKVRNKDRRRREKGGDGLVRIAGKQDMRAEKERMTLGRYFSATDLLRSISRPL